MRLRTAFLGLSCFCWGFAQACGGDSGVNLDGSTDGTVQNDVTPPPPDSGNDVVNIPDTGPGDTGTDTGTTQDGSTDGGVQDSGTANITSWQCGSVTVSDCSQCTGFQQPCAYCNFADASVLKGVCTQMYTGCQNAIPNGYQDCPCQDASTCIEGYQVCTQFGGRCHTCTDNTQNAGLKCENGGTCSPDAGCL